jgi:hypothetical protein
MHGAVNVEPPRQAVAYAPRPLLRPRRKQKLRPQKREITSLVVPPARISYAFDWVERAVIEITKNPIALLLTRNRQNSTFCPGARASPEIKSAYCLDHGLLSAAYPRRSSGLERLPTKGGVDDQRGILSRCPASAELRQIRCANRGGRCRGGSEAVRRSRFRGRRGASCRRHPSQWRLFHSRQRLANAARGQPDAPNGPAVRARSKWCHALRAHNRHRRTSCIGGAPRCRGRPGSL